jgi:cobalt/nickel transport system ATP-binding protein
MKPLIEVKRLSYSYPDGKSALREVSFRLEEGENVALLGPNGSGKTTLLLHLNGTLLGQGSISVAGVTLSKHTMPQVRRAVGMLFQDPDGQLFMPTVLEDVMFGLLNLRYSREEAESRAKCALNLVGLSEEYSNRPPFHLSAGEKRRVALAGVLAMEPSLLVLDEPTSWLDPPGQRGLTELLKGLPQPKLIATHDAAFAKALTTRAIFLKAGSIAADGPVDKILSDFDWYS